MFTKHTKIWKKWMSGIVAIGMAIPVMLFGTAGAEEIDLTTLYKNKDVTEGWSLSEAQAIDLNTVSENMLTISEKGDYILSGTWSGQIVVEAPEEEKVRLILNGVNITSPEGPAIYEKSADKLIITLAEGTENILTDGTAIVDGDDTIGAALYAEDDLSINGEGTLIAHGTVKHGIQSKSDLIIANGKITVDAVSDAIRGRNSVLVLDGDLKITTNGDGIVSTRTDKEGKGWIIIAGGNIEITAGGGAGEIRVSANSRGGGGRGGWGRGGNMNTQQMASSASTTSQKAIKAATDLTVLGGTLTFNTADDGLHGVNVTVNGGNFTIATGDDGMHADNEMVVNGGTINITQCYEGIEGQNVTISGGVIHILASDDGINASGGNDGSGFGGRGGDKFSGGNGAMLTITGGTLAVSAGGDGLDSNGSISITGGVVGVWAATSTGEGAIDLNGTGTISGGTLIVASTGGVMSDTASLSGQAMMVLSSSGTMSGTISLLDANGNTLGSFTPDYSFDTVIVSSDQLPEGSAFSMTCAGQQIYQGNLASNLSSAGNSGFGRGNKRGW